VYCFYITYDKDQSSQESLRSLELGGHCNVE